jgi:hypothetical protein
MAAPYAGSPSWLPGQWDVFESDMRMRHGVWDMDILCHEDDDVRDVDGDAAADDNKNESEDREDECVQKALLALMVRTPMVALAPGTVGAKEAGPCAPPARVFVCKGLEAAHVIRALDSLLFRK